MPGWNFADVWERVADRIPDATALVHGDERRTWAELDRRADGLARTLLERGVHRQDKVAQYLYNRNEYIESLFAAYKAALVPVNTNYRYTEDELVYLWDNADAVAVVFEGTFTERVDAARDRVPRVATWLWVDDGTHPCPDWAIPYEEAAGAGGGRVDPPGGRDGDDLYLLYTGGTTGMPKGVMWRQDDLLAALNASNLGTRYDLDRGYEQIAEVVTEPGLVGLPACPLMHGTGAFTSMGALSSGGSIVTLTKRSFDPVELLDTVEREGVNVLAIVGDAFAKPILRALDAEPGRWDISSLMAVISSGVMWSEETKQGLLGHHAGMLLVDAFSSSEALGMGQSVSSAAGSSKTARFSLGQNARVITEDGRDVEPGSGEIGRLAVKGRQPIGYYKDPDKTAATFVVLDGERFSIPGDWATVDADGTVTILGRGSVCINTGGEKVFPEEVEEVLKTHPAVLDAVAVGVPDEKFGEVVTAVVEPAPGTTVDEAAVIGHVRSRLAAYKAPKRVLTIESIGRAANGKVDYQALKEYATGAVRAEA